MKDVLILAWLVGGFALNINHQEVKELGTSVVVAGLLVLKTRTLSSFCF